MNSDNRKAMFAQLKNGEKVAWNKENIHRVPHKPGHYEFYKGSQLIYVGVAGGFSGKVGDLRHRLQAHNETDDFSASGHKSKKEFRDFLDANEGKIKFRIYAESIGQARLHEHQLKQKAKFNEDNTNNEEKNHGVTVHHVKI